MGELLHLVHFVHVTFWLDGAAARPDPSSLCQDLCNIPPIHGQCTNHRIAVFISLWMIVTSPLRQQVRCCVWWPVFVNFVLFLPRLFVCRNGYSCSYETMRTDGQWQHPAMRRGASLICLVPLMKRTAGNKPSGFGDDHFRAELVEFLPQISRLHVARDVATNLTPRPRDLVADDVIARRRRCRPFLHVYFRSVVVYTKQFSTKIRNISCAVRLYEKWSY